jgi:C-terminal processing protease CtpA/Prc
MKQIQNDGIKHLIIDIRDNPGGYVYDVYELLSYFTDEKFTVRSIYKITERNRTHVAKMLKNEYRLLYGKKHPEVIQSMEIFNSMTNGSIFRSDTILPMQYTVLKPVKYKYTGKSYLLTNGLSYSASVIFADLFKSRKLGLIAGESPGGYNVVSSGNIVEIGLPYSTFMSLNVPVEVPETAGNCEYIEPDILIEPTFEEWLYNKHDSLKKLVAMILEDKISRK